MAADPSIVEVNRIFRHKPDKADRELAWQILGLQATAAVPAPVLPPLANFIIHVNNLLRQIAPENFYHLGRFGNLRVYDRKRHQHRAATAVHKVLSAIFTLGDFGCSLWPPFYQDSRFKISALDRPIDAPAWNGLAPPMGPALFAAHLTGLPAENARPQPGLRLVGPTWREVGLARQSRIARRLADGQYMADGAQQWPVQPTGQNMDVRPTLPDGHCYWYAVSQALFGPANWERFAEVKASIRRYFMAVLSNHLHPRYRTYVEIEINSRRASAMYGTTSINRCLHDNSSIKGAWHFGGPPCFRPSHHLGINQVIADYYDIELIEIENPIAWLPAPVPLPAPLVPPEVPRARGINGRPQYFIWQVDGHFYSASQNAADAGGPFPTSIVNRERVEDMPWHPAAPAPIPTALMPTPMPAGSGVNDPLMQPTAIEIAYVEANRSYPGMRPRFPTDANRARWGGQVPGPMDHAALVAPPPPSPGMPAGTVPLSPITVWRGVNPPTVLLTVPKLVRPKAKQRPKKRR